MIDGWPKTYDKVEQLAATQFVRQYDPKALADFKYKIAKIKPDAELAAQSAKMLGLYLQTLGQLAGGDVTDVSKQASSIQASIKNLGGSSPDVSLAADTLSLVLNSWQSAALAANIKRSDHPVQVITKFLAATADDVRTSEKEAKDASGRYWGAIAINSGSLYISVISQRAIDEDNVFYDEQITKALAAKSAFYRIGEDHSTLANTNNLSSVRATLVSDLPLLEDALRTILH